jgi:glycosyltransferase involved in cell wall biosynthesis
MSNLDRQILIMNQLVSNMRVAIITENFLPKLDGVTRTLARLLEHLETTGHQALLLGPEAGMERYAGAEVIGTGGIPLFFYPELKINFFRPLFFRRLHEFRPDIMHIVDPVMFGPTGLAAARLLDIPIVSSYHTNLAAYCAHFGFEFFTRPMWLYNRFIHNQCALTFCPSPSTATMLQAQGFERLCIWTRGVDTTLFHASRRSLALRDKWLGTRTDLEETEQPVILLYVGRISWEKNLHLLIQAYRGMDHQHCHLVMVGNGPAFAEVQSQLQGLPVTFTGYLTGKDLAAAYASADIFAFPSYTETFGQVVLEAMASGLPVVGLEAEGVCDLVSHERSGLLLNMEVATGEEQVEVYRTCLTRLVDNWQERACLSQCALMEASRRTWHEAMEALVDGYRKVAEQKTQRLTAA